MCVCVCLRCASVIVGKAQTDTLQGIKMLSLLLLLQLLLYAYVSVRVCAPAYKPLRVLN